MAFVPTPRGIKVALDFVIEGKIVTVTFSVETAAAVNSTDLTNATQVPASWWATTGGSQFSNETSLGQTVAYDLTSATAPVVTNPITTPVSGAVANHSVPANVALVTSERTVNRGRSGRGRMYWPGLPTNALTDDTRWLTSVITAVATLVQSLSTQLASSGLVMSVLSRYSGVDPITHKPIPRASGVLQPINFFRADQTIGTQRRRVLAL